MSLSNVRADRATAPALEAVEYHDIDFINDFNSTSIYRGPPTPEREEAWDKLTYSMTDFHGFATSVLIS